MNTRYFSLVAALVIVSQVSSCKKMSTESSRSATQYSISLPPAAPLNVAGVGGDKQVTLTWKAPDGDGGRVITDYMVQYSLDGEKNWTLVADDVSTATNAIITELINGNTYFFRVAAVNAVGVGNYSERSDPVILALSRTLYFNNAVDGDWQTLGNWWLDDQFTVPATKLPTSVDDVHILGPIDAAGRDVGVLSNSGVKPTVANVYVNSSKASNIYISIELHVSGLATFDGENSYLYTDYPENGFAIINGNCSFINGASVWSNSYVISDAVINGNATFHNDSYNERGTINGVATFHNDSYNSGTINGNAIFNDQARNRAELNIGMFTGVVAGSAIFNDNSSDQGIVLNRKPGAPLNLSGVSGNANGQVDLSWAFPAVNSAGITGYIVQYKLQSAEEWSSFGAVASVVTNRSVTGLNIGQSYVFRVAAINSIGQGPYSSEISLATADWVDVTTTDGTTSSSCVSTSGNCTMKDNITGLWWSKHQGQGDWDYAATNCADLIHNGNDDWRLPTYEELLVARFNSIISASKSNWMTQELISNIFWSGTAGSDEGLALRESLINVSIFAQNVVKTSINHVVCVR